MATQGGPSRRDQRAGGLNSVCVSQDWLEVSVVTSSEAVEAVSEMLMDLGAGGVVIDDPRLVMRRVEQLGTALIDEPDAGSSPGNAGPMLTGVTVKAYLPADTSAQVLVGLSGTVRRLVEAGLDPGLGQVSARMVHAEDWANAWKKYYTLQRIGRRLVIVPSWLTYEPRPGEVLIRLDPGMAFGTGTHPTTRLCLQALEGTVAPHDFVLDLGTGSGILAIAAAKLGARVHALDIDSRAVSVAQENVEANGVATNVTVATGVVDDVQEMRFDIIVANIIAETIVKILPRVAGYLRPGGCFIASGIVAERMGAVRAAWAESGLVITQERQIDEWFCVTGGRQS